MHPVATTIRTIINETADEFFERRPLIEAMWLGILCREHVFVVGAPGTSKSMVVRHTFDRLIGARQYEVTLSKQRPEAAVLGPYNLPMLRDTGLYVRKDDGYLTTADVAMLDEIGKSSPTLGHDLLAALNERVKHQVDGTGRSVHPIPLHTVIAPSNEMIVQESEDAAALWDRLLVRVRVDYIQEPGNFTALLFSAAKAGRTPTRTTIPWADVVDAVANVVPTIDLGQDAVDAISELKEKLRAAGITVSDRRWYQCVKLLQASAFLNGRSRVEDDDVQVLRYALWDAPEQISTVERLALSVSNPLAEKCLALLDDAEQIAGGIRDRKGESDTAKAQYGSEANGKLKVIEGDLNRLRQECLQQGRSTTKVDEVADRLKAIKRSIYTDLLGMDLP